MWIKFVTLLFELLLSVSKEQRPGEKKEGADKRPRIK